MGAISPPLLGHDHDSLSRTRLPASLAPSPSSARSCLFRPDNVRHHLYLTQLGNVACPTDTALSLSDRHARLCWTTGVLNSDLLLIQPESTDPIIPPLLPHAHTPPSTHLFHFPQRVRHPTHLCPPWSAAPCPHQASQFIFTSACSPCN